MSDEGSCVASSLIPNAHMSEVVLILALYVETSSDDPRKELDAHDNVVVLGSISFVFESTGRIFIVQPFSIDLKLENYVPIVDGALAHDFP